jgi:mono/diheme cytochrome c family protein
MPGLKRLLITVGGTLALTAGACLADPGDSATPAAAGAAEQGAEIFGSHGCGYCHENGGRSAGKGPQLMNTARDDGFIMFRVKHGKEARMPAFGGSLTDAQIVDIIAYIRSLKDVPAQ